MDGEAGAGVALALVAAPGGGGVDEEEGDIGFGEGLPSLGGGAWATMSDEEDEEAKVSS